METNGEIMESGYRTVNGLRMYYEIYGNGFPLILLHGGGSTIQTSFGRIIPLLAKHFKVVGIELQAHGRTGDREAQLSFEQDADDVIVLMDELGIERAHVFGFSNGGTTAIQMAIRHPLKIAKVIAASALFKRNGAPTQFWEFMSQATLDHMPQAYKDEYKAVAPNPEQLYVMHDKCAHRMIHFSDISDDMLRKIKSPVMIVLAEQDVMTITHGQEIQKLIPGSELVIFPGGHGAYMGEITTLTGSENGNFPITPLLESFLK